MVYNPPSFRWSLCACRFEQAGWPRSGHWSDGLVKGENLHEFLLLLGILVIRTSDCNEKDHSTELRCVFSSGSAASSYIVGEFEKGEKLNQNAIVRCSFRLLTPHARRTFLISVIQPDLEYAALTFTPSMNAGLRNRLLAESNPLRSRCWTSRWSNPSPQWVPAYQHCWSMDRTICVLCSPMCETRSSVYVMCEIPTASSPPSHQRTGEFLSSVPGEQSCWSCIFFEPCSTSLELFTCWRSGSTITVFF